MTYQTPYNVKFPTYTGATLSAKGDGVTNDTAAIQAAVKACAQAGGGEVYFPKGVYRVGSNTLNALASTDIPAGAGSVAINFVGEGKWASIIQLDPALFTGQGYILYTPTTYTTQIGSSFTDIGFYGSPRGAGFNYSNINSTSNGFYFYGSDSPGVFNQSYRFTRCMMQGFNIHFDFEGTESCSEVVHVGCTYQQNKTALYKLNNLQSFNHSFYSTDMEELYGDGFYFGAGGGGAVQIFGGSFIMLDNGTTSNRWAVNSPIALTGGIQPIKFTGTRFELRGNYTNLLNVIGDNTVRATFRDAFILDEATAAKSSWLNIGNLSRVDFEGDCEISQQNGYATNVTVRGSADYGEPGTVIFDKTTLPVDFSDQCAITGWVGLISARNIQGANTNDPSQTQHRANDFDLLGGISAKGQYTAWSHTALPGAGGLSALQPRLKTAWMKAPAEYFPGSSSSEITLKMPKGALVKSIYLRAAAGGFDTTSTKWQVTDNTKAAVHLQTAAAAANTAFAADLEKYFYCLGSAVNDRTLRLSMTAYLASGYNSGGFVMVEYY